MRTLTKDERSPENRESQQETYFDNRDQFQSIQERDRKWGASYTQGLNMFNTGQVGRKINLMKMSHISEVSPSQSKIEIKTIKSMKAGSM